MNEDLSEFQAPISDLFSAKNLLVDITEGQSNFFKENGYLAGIRLLCDDQIAELRAELERMMRPEYAGDERFYEYNSNESSDPAKRLFHALGAWRVSRAFHDLIFNPVLVSVAERLLGGPVRFWHDQLFVKPTRDGAVVAWHQDYSYWTRTKPVCHLTCWIGLDDATIENGCVQYVPGSHQWELLPKTDLANDMDAVLSVLDPEQKAAFRPVAIELKAGEATFHHSMMLHGSYENRSEKPRRAVVINVFRDGVFSDSDEPLLEGVPVIPKGNKIEGRFFPLLTKPGNKG